MVSPINIKKVTSVPPRKNALACDFESIIISFLLVNKIFV